MTAYARFLDTMNFGVIWIVIMWIMVTVEEFGCTVSMEFESRPQVDLLKSLGVFNRNISRDRSGVVSTSGPYGSRPAVRLFGERRDFRVPDPETTRVLNILRSASEFTFIAHIQQDELNTGVLISYAEDFNRVFELQSSGRKDEIRLHYLHKGQVHVESFRYRLSDARWHRLAVTVSDSEVTVFVDCQQVYKRVIRTPDKELDIGGKNMSLWVGQRGDDHFLFQGSMQDVRIVSGPNGHVVQCPVADSSCPTCGQFSSLQMTVSMLESYVKELASKLIQAEQRLSLVEECECRKSCSWNDTQKSDGDSWKNGCDECTCRRGEFVCKPVQCPAVTCKNPVLRPGECCPVCLRRCLYNTVYYDHGEKEQPSQKCRVCKCKDGTMKCSNLNTQEFCPPLDCPLSEQVSEPDGCCKFCPDTDYCGKGHDCHSNATCINLKTTFMCQCESGFFGDGKKNCSDINECTDSGGSEGHLCGNNTLCVNTVGSYKCDCLEGHTRLDNYTCSEIDECETGAHDCHVSAHCINNAGSYSCECAAGYDGDGKNCTPICSNACQNGGFCQAPELCSCRTGFTGTACDLDLDECALGLHKCDQSSECVNKHGWYDCKCKTGYRGVVDHDGEQLQTSCVDVDECAERIHTCHEEHDCVNIDGGFQCKCSEKSSNCSIGCVTPTGPKAHLSVWAPADSTCTVCACDKGVTKCQPLPCQCDVIPSIDTLASLELQLKIEKFVATRKMAKSCCKHCGNRKEVCLHQEDKKKEFKQGDVWIHQCQTCECLHGEIDCWSLECAPASCDHPVLLPGDCCPRCPDDPCGPPQNTNSTNSNEIELGCHYAGQFYSSGTSWPLDQDICTSCTCKNGRACCHYDPGCSKSMSGHFFSDTKRSSINDISENGYRKTTSTFSGRFSKPTPQDFKSTVERISEKHSTHSARWAEKYQTQSPRLRRNIAAERRKGLRTRYNGEKKKKMKVEMEKNK